MTSNRKKRRDASKLPLILVLEGLSGGYECVEDAGGRVKIVDPYNVKDVTEALKGKYAGLLLTGGGDVDPRRYGEKPNKNVYGVNQSRDANEILALEAARLHNWPVLGICRGAQIMTVEAGGKLRQHIAFHNGGRHAAFTEKGSLLRRASGYIVLPKVCSYHHQEMKTPGKGFVHSGYADDGVIEAVESVDGRCLGVQFHPEMTWDTYSQNIFRWLVLESAHRAGLPIPPLPVRYTKKVSYDSQAWDSQAWSDDDEVRWTTWKLENGKNWKPTPSIGANPKAKQITTGVPTTASAEVKHSWFCPHCTIPMFDTLADRNDHIRVLHPDKVKAQTKTKVRAT